MSRARRRFRISRAAYAYNKARFEEEGFSLFLSRRLLFSSPRCADLAGETKREFDTVGAGRGDCGCAINRARELFGRERIVEKFAFVARDFALSIS